jgi:hypothetical protein
MGSSADATIAWGVRLFCAEEDDDYEETERLQDIVDENYDWVDKALGFTAEHPAWPVDAQGEKIDDRQSAEWIGWQVESDNWRAIKDAIVTIEVDSYGDRSSGYTGTVLVITRTKTNVNWGCDVVKPESLIPPTFEELEALNKCLDYLDFKGDRSPELMLFACYG